MRYSGVPVADNLPDWAAELLFRNGLNGVTVFFAISGFLITLTSLRRFGSLGAIDIGRFYRIRFARIAPLLLALLAVLSVLHWAGARGFTIAPEVASLRRAVVAVLTFHLNWLEAERGYLPACWDVLWSLSVEEMFYLGYPPLCVLLGRRRIALVLALGVFVALGPVARTAWAGNEIWRDKSYLSGMEAIAMGCLAALGMEQVRAWGRGRLALLEALGGLAMAGVAVWPGRDWLHPSVLAAGTCAVMAGSVARGGAGGRWTEPVRWLGRHSYEIYLTHGFVVVWGTRALVKAHWGSPAAWVFLLLAGAVATGAMTARYFSEPMNRVLRG